jgi:D-proline reductase (dithiol) PrdB
MTPDDLKDESFEEFKNSFSYGSRTDLNFKFLRSLSNEEAARFFQELLRKLGDSLDDGKFDRIVEHICEWQASGYGGRVRGWTYDEGPFTALRKPISESRLALLTSSGHFVEGDDPQPFGVQNMTQGEAMERIGEFLKTEPTLSSIPKDTPQEKLRMRHGGYDIRGSWADRNVVFPLERLRELEGEGIIGELSPEAYSFVGACSQQRLLKRVGPQWVKLLQQQRIDAVLLVPV